MTDYLKPSFTVSQRGRDPASCSHGMVRLHRGAIECAFCGERWSQEDWRCRMEDEALQRAKGEP